MTSVITRLCLRDGGCVDVCPVEGIVAGNPVEQWPWFYVDPDSCIDCGACIPECPYEAIFMDDDVPSDYTARGGEVVSMPAGTDSYDKPYQGTNHAGEAVELSHTRTLEAGEVLDLTPDTETNAEFFTNGPGYDA